MYDKCYFCLDQLPKLKKESTASFFVNFGGAGVQKSRPTLLYRHSHLCLNNKTQFLCLKNITEMVTFLLLNKVRSGAPIECTCRLSASTFLGKMGARLLSAPKSSALKSEYQAQNCPSPLRIRAAWAPSLCLDQYCFAKLIKQGTASGRKGFTSQVFKFACLLHRQNTGKPSQVQIDEGFIE